MLRFLLAVIVLAVLATASSVTTQAQRRPLVFVPGVMGSKLCKGDKLVWGDKWSYKKNRLLSIEIPINNDDSSLNDNIHSCGIINQITIIPYFWTQPVYTSLIDQLGELGFKESDNNLLIFDYDFGAYLITTMQNY